MTMKTRSWSCGASYEVYKAEELPFLRMMPRRADFTPHWDEVNRDRDEVISTLEAEAKAAKES